MKKFLCYDTNDAASGKINVDSRGMLNPNSTVPSTNGSTNQYLVTDGEGNTKWEDRLAYGGNRIRVSMPESADASEYIKVSDDLPTGSYDIGTRVYEIDSDGDDYEHDIIVSNGEVIADDGYEPNVIVALHDNVTFLSDDDWSITLPEKGTYFAKYENYFITGVVLGDSNEPEITWDGSIFVGKKIEQMYIPENIAIVEHINNPDIHVTSEDKTGWNDSIKIHTINVELPGYNWYSVTYGDGKFVAVSDGTTAAYSLDGITWTKTTLPASANWYSVTYGDGKFVAVKMASTTAAYSLDGITWTKTTLPVSDNWSSVTYGDGKFVAVINNSSTTAAYSLDGITWKNTFNRLKTISGTDVTEQVKEALQFV